jgi:DNA-directed RNA polymerase subunit M/transcription elongation factor TFIIS
MDKEKIDYNDWKTGEKRQYILNDYTSDIEHKTKLFCPFDNTPLIFAYDERDKTLSCPNCGEQYHPHSRSQEEINNQSKAYALRKKNYLKEIEEKRADLEARVKHAEEVGLI